MKGSELRANLSKWVGEYSSLTETNIPPGIIPFLANRIEESVFIENDPDVIDIDYNGKTQKARILSEDRAGGCVRLSLISDRSTLVMSYASLRKASSGSQIATALDKLRGPMI